MIRLCAFLLWLALESAVRLALEPLIRLWLAVRPIRRIRQWRTRRKMRSWREEHGLPLDEVSEDFNSLDEVSMDSVKGAFKSKLVWLGLVQVGYGLFELWANGALTAESAGPVISGALTVLFRAVTSQSLADKAK